MSTFQAPKGFWAGGERVGIKKRKDALDLAIISSYSPCSVAATFTQNKFCAAPVILCRELLQKHPTNISSVVVTSGCANAVTGVKGLEDAKRIQKLMEISDYGKSFVMSTGVIGEYLPMDLIEKAFEAESPVGSKKFLSEEELGWQRAAQAFMTTDTSPKLASRQFKLGDGPVFTVSGIAKGAGMIHPNMATLLGAITTDVGIPAAVLQNCLKSAVDKSFNSITVDGDTSTNDTIVCLANGAAGSVETEEQITNFQSCLDEVCIDLAQKIVKDGEGATKFVTICLEGASTHEEAKTAAMCIAKSSLCKTAFFGEDANWGRIICALGYSGIQFNPTSVGLWLEGNNGPSLQLMQDGQPCKFDEGDAKPLLQQKEFGFRVKVGNGSGSATVWTCDFSLDYVTINADYRS